MKVKEYSNAEAINAMATLWHQVELQDYGNGDRESFSTDGSLRKPPYFYLNLWQSSIKYGFVLRVLLIFSSFFITSCLFLLSQLNVLLVDYLREELRFVTHNSKNNSNNSTQSCNFEDLEIRFSMMAIRYQEVSLTMALNVDAKFACRRERRVEVPTPWLLS